MILKTLKKTIIATGSRAYWNEELIVQFCEKTQNLDQRKIIKILEYFIDIGEQFKYADLMREIHKQIYSQQKLLENKTEIQPGYNEIVVLCLQRIALATQQKTTIGFYEVLEPVHEALVRLNVWREDGKWAEWVRENRGNI